MFSGTAYPLGLKERKHMNKAASQYLREVKKRIHCSRSLKTEFLFQLEDEVDFFCEDFDGVDFSILSERFGTPDDVAREFLTELGLEVVSSASRKRQHILYFAVSVIFLIAVFSAVVEIYTNYQQKQALDGYYVESITYEEDVTPYVISPSYLTDDFNDNISTDN